MIWELIFLAAIVALGLGLYQLNRSDRHYLDDGFGWFMTAALLGLVWFIACLAGTATIVNEQLSAESDRAVIAARKVQRDSLADLIRDELSAEQYAELMAALPTDGDARLFLGDGASRVLITRADQIIAINAEVFGRELSVIEKQKNVCDYVRNPFTPRFWFGLGLPDCTLDLTAGES